MRVQKKPEFFVDGEKLLRHLLLEQQASESMHTESANQFAFNYSRILPTISSSTSCVKRNDVLIKMNIQRCRLSRKEAPREREPLWQISL